MERPSVSTWFIPIVISGFGVVTTWATPRVRLTAWGAMIAYGALGVVAIGCFILRKHEYARWKDEDARLEREKFLDGEITCLGGCADRLIKRRDAWRAPGYDDDLLCGPCLLLKKRIDVTKPGNGGAVRRFPDAPGNVDAK